MNSLKSGTQRAFSILLQRGDADRCTVIFEPYGSEYELLDDDTLRVTFAGASDGNVEVVHRLDSILLWPGNGLQYLVAVNGRGERQEGLF